MGTLLASSFAQLAPARADIQPPLADEIPEEILRTEIIFEARSPLDGSPLSPEAYAELQAQLQAPPNTPLLIHSDIRSLILLLQLRRAIRPVLPILP
ncbi:MAG: hypothetical protein F6J97_08805 [Leptolyngbya sp. SIO4C1]|nr:hypothetical protein [Leptolyngbya sp. SIO4C1]